MQAMTFRDSEKERYKELKPKLFIPEARCDGYYRRHPYFFCLADDYSCENLYKTIRECAIGYFGCRHIPWHDGLDKRHLPSNHLCCSQSCCVNFLYPMTTNPKLLASVFRYFYPELAEPLPVDKDLPLKGSFPYMAFEWIGVRDYLGEAKRKGAERTRGAYFTSADFIFRFEREDGKIQIVLGEWKYTEDYRRLDKGIEVRKQNYHLAFNRDGGVFKQRGENLYGALFFDPFYQLMRLQLLAQEMELSREMGADVVSVLHICPEANREFRDRVTSPHLADMFPDKGVLEIRKELVPQDKFMSISVEDLLKTIIERVTVDDQGWADYLSTRYGWDRLSKKSSVATPVVTSHSS